MRHFFASLRAERSLVYLKGYNLMNIVFVLFILLQRAAGSSAAEKISDKEILIFHFGCVGTGFIYRGIEK